MPELWLFVDLPDAIAGSKSFRNKQTNTMNQQLQKPSELDTLRAALEKATPKLAEVAQKHLKPERLIRLLLSAGSRNPKILQCSQSSVLQFAMKCAETGLEPIGAGGAWPVPYENRKNGTVELQFIPDYRGLVNCAKRARCIKDAYAEVVKAKDVFDYELGMAPHLRHKPARGDRGGLEAAYCKLVFPDNTERFVFMDGSEIISIRDRTQAWIHYKKTGAQCPWVTDESEQWKKTVIRRAMKQFVGMSAALDTAIEADDRDSGVVVMRDPIAMPKAIDAAPEPIPEPLPSVEDDQVPGAEVPVEEPKPTPQEPTGEQSHTCVIVGVNQGVGKGPATIVTDPPHEPRFKSFSVSVQQQARDFAASQKRVKVFFKVETKGNYTNAMVTSIGDSDDAPAQRPPAKDV